MKLEHKLLLSFIGFGVLLYIMNRTLNITIKREILNDKRTIGKMYLNGEYFCDTLEDKYRGQDLSNTKIDNETAIPNGIYNLIVNFSQKFQKSLPILLNVPFFTGIRIHTGANEKDTSGCILLGDYKNNVWSSNANYVKELTALIPQYSKAVINITSV